MWIESCVCRYSLLQFCRFFSHIPKHLCPVSESGVSPAAFRTVTHLIQRTCHDEDDEEEGLTFTVSRGYPTATPKAPEHTDQNTVTCNITEKLWILSCFRRLELLVKQSHIYIRTSDRTGDEIREVHHDENQQNRSQRNRYRTNRWIRTDHRGTGTDPTEIIRTNQTD